MCGLAGLILGKKRRRADEREYLTWLFTRILVASENLGPHATGVAWLNNLGEHALFKRPVRASQLVVDKAFHEMISSVDNRTTLLMGHTRWRTRGDERNNLNNHPLLGSGIVLTHNGTVVNADELFKRYRLKRRAEVDSEVLVRLAGRAAAKDGGVDIEALRRLLRPCRGQMSGVLACRRDPETILLLKGNKPLELRWNRKRRTIFYASEGSYLDAILMEDPGWRTLDLAPMSVAVVDCGDLTQLTITPLEFITQGRSTQKGLETVTNSMKTTGNSPQNPRGSTQ